MTRSIIFKTPGLIDLRAFTTFGVNAKPATDNPIGYFGTGLKYAIAVLLREKQQVVLWRGKVKYTFYVKDTDFRDRSFAIVRMKKEDLSWLDSVTQTPFKPKYEELPFTTELGKNWELWQAFRELETNTRDEQGETFEATSIASGTAISGTTVIVVTGAAFAKEYDERFKTFLDPSLQFAEHWPDELEIYAKPSHQLYYRGMRVMDIPDKLSARYTYNILSTQMLTEDRTLVHPFLAESMICEHIARSTDREFIKGIVTAKGTWEEKFTWDYVYQAPSVEFLATIQQLTSKAAGRSYNYASGYFPRQVKTDPWTAWPRPWTLRRLTAGGEFPYLDAEGNEVPYDGLQYALKIINEHKDMEPIL